MTHRVSYGDQTLAFRVRYCTSLTTKVVIHVQPNRAIVVDAPAGTTLTSIKKALLKRARWTSNQLRKIDELHRNALPRQYVSGETHLYLGKRYLLKVNVDKNAMPGTKLIRGRLVASVPVNDPHLVRAALAEWYQHRAKVVFANRIEAIYPSLSWVKHKPSWQLRAMKKQWGSCSVKGKLSLNPLLVKAPRACIDYVIVHELCHLKYRNHGPAFQRTLRSCVPEWPSIKERLDKMAEVIYNE